LQDLSGYQVGSSGRCNASGKGVQVAISFQTSRFLLLNNAVGSGKNAAARNWVFTWDGLAL
jgi:hypothetical protein